MVLRHVILMGRRAAHCRHHGSAETKKSGQFLDRLILRVNSEDEYLKVRIRAVS